MNIRLSVIVFLSFMAQVVVGQIGSEAHIRDIINEKIRVPANNIFAHDSYDVHLKIERGEVSKEEGKTMLHTLRENLDHDQISVRDVESIDEGAEPCIALNPKDPDQMVMSFMQFDDFPIYYSDDAGSTWKKSVTTITQMWRKANPASGGMTLGGGDPILVYDIEGVIHLTWVMLDFDFNAFMLYATSDDGGATFNLAQEGKGYIGKGSFFTGLDILDREWLASDHSGGPHDGKTYYASVYFGGSLGASGIMTFSTPFGERNFSNPTLAIPDNGQAVQFSSLKVSDNGTVHLGCYMADSGTGNGHAVYTQSTDGGQAWSSINRVGVARSKFPDPNETKEIHARENTAVSLAVSGDNVYMVWTHQSNAQHQGFYAYSNDNGITWSQPLEFGLQVSTDAFYHFFANIAASEDRATISWYEVNKQTLMSNYKMVEITDNGQTFGIPQTVSTTPTNFTGAGTSQFKFYGDYNTSVKNGCFTHAVWADGTQEPTIYVTKFDGCQDASAITEITPVNVNIAMSAIYPNPVGPTLFIEMEVFKGSEDIGFTLTANDGKLIKKLSSNKLTEGKHLLEFDVDMLEAGTYFIQVQMEGGVFITRSFVKG